MKKILLTLLVLTSILGTNNCSPETKNTGSLDKFIPLALLGGNTGDIASGSNSADGGNNNGSGNTSPSVVEAPTFSPVAGHYTTPQNIGISTTTSGADIYYTTDGSEPTTSSTPYTQPLHIWRIAGKTIKAIAVKTSLANSPTLAGQFSYPPLKTGQTTSYATGDDGANEYGATRSYTGPTQHTTYTSDYTTTDNATGFVWKTCSQGKSGATCATGTALSMNWLDAQTGTNGCNALNSTNSGNGYAGIKTWRLPNRRELESLQQYELGSPSINMTVFPGTNAYHYWSSTEYANIPSLNAWVVSFESSIVMPAGKIGNVHVRCISGNSNEYSSSFSDGGGGIVKDNVTGLIWQKCSRGQTNDSSCTGTATTTTWGNAITYCNGLNLLGKTWRLPNVNELRSILDINKANFPTINLTIFPSSVNNVYWSSTTFDFDTTFAWHVDFQSNGGIYRTYDKPSTYYVRCVTGP
ncbi:MAG: DUF1566 domain-containing protein [Leptospiraceae bacterium]|nr:DUF1566 domain-containing protein [Leptospiraceae bacterium]